MNSNLSTAAWVAHNVGVAAGFGGALFGKAALNPAIRAVEDERQRGKVLGAAWGGFNIINTISTGLAALTWIMGRTLLSGKEIDRSARGLVIAKDVLVGTMAATTAATAIGGALLRQSAPQGNVPVKEGGKPAPHAPRRQKGLLRALDVLGYVNLAAAAGVLGLTTAVAMKAGKSGKFSVVAGLLP